MKIVRLTTRIFPDKAGPAVYAYYLSENVSSKEFHMFNITCRPTGIKYKTKVVNPYFKIFFLPITATRWDVNPLKQLFFFDKIWILFL